MLPPFWSTVYVSKRSPGHQIVMRIYPSKHMLIEGYHVEICLLVLPTSLLLLTILSYFTWWNHSSVRNLFWNEQGKSEGFDSCDRPSTQIGFKSSIFQPVWPWNLMDDPENNRAPPLCYFKLFASIHSHRWIQTGVTVRKRLIWVKIDDFLSSVTLRFDGWPWKTIGHRFYATSSFVQHFVPIGEFKLELQSGNAQFGSKSKILLAAWPSNLTDDIEKQQGPYSMLFQALCIISYPLVNSN